LTAASAKTIPRQKRHDGAVAANWNALSCAHDRARRERAVELQAKPGAEFAGVGKGAPHARTGSAELDLLFDAIAIERMEPERLFSFRWHPGAAEPGYDYSAEPTTLVEEYLAQKAQAAR
jgi:hypothetical protein